ncbi:MAG TPA: nucleotidyltransferase family protein, partial [Pyrinomonadaceae bacterium]|nr:nucleotidyltransferase family protein [Pyrinomonadaceae bacterium]
SRRMGAFKPLLPFPSGRTAVEACIESLRAAGVGEIVVVVGHRADEVRAALKGAAVEFAVNDEPESEMGVSVARGVEKVSDKARAVLVGLVDQPAVTPEDVRGVLEARAGSGARLVVPTWEGRGGHPVLVDLAFREELLGVVAREGLRALFDAHREEVLRLPAASPYVARDVDTWEDYRALYAEVFGVAPPDERRSYLRKGAPRR